MKVENYTAPRPPQSPLLLTQITFILLKNTFCVWESNKAPVSGLAWWIFFTSLHYPNNVKAYQDERLTLHLAAKTKYFSKRVSRSLRWDYKQSQPGNWCQVYVESRNHRFACSKSDRRKLQFTIAMIRVASVQSTTLPSTSLLVNSTSSKPL